MLRINFRNITRLRKAQANSFPLPDRIIGNAFVASEHCAGFIDKIAGLHRLAGIGF